MTGGRAGVMVLHHAQSWYAHTTCCCCCYISPWASALVCHTLGVPNTLHMRQGVGAAGGQPPPTHPVAGAVRIAMLSSWPHPATHAQDVPASHTVSLTSSARGTMSALPSSASSIVPSDSPARLCGSRRLRTCVCEGGCVQYRMWQRGRHDWEGHW